MATLENDDLGVRVMTRHGGRITSLLNRRDGREWLIGPRATGGPVPRLDDVFTQTDHCGWDEMLPTVDPCRYPGEPYPDVALADHGELWTASWETLTQTATNLHQRVEGQRLRYSFERTLALRGATLRCEYRCETPVDTEMLWAAHPQFVVREGTRLRLEPSPAALWDVSEGAAHTRPWPGDLIVERDVPAGGDAMWYADPTSTISSASLTDPDGSSLTMTWDLDAAPYFGVWADHGRYSVGRVVAMEPTNGFFDELARASAQGRVTRWRAREPLTWWVEVALVSSSGAS